MCVCVCACVYVDIWKCVCVHVHVMCMWVRMLGCVCICLCEFVCASSDAYVVCIYSCVCMQKASAGTPAVVPGSAGLILQAAATYTYDETQEVDKAEKQTRPPSARCIPRCM